MPPVETPEKPNKPAVLPAYRRVEALLRDQIRDGILVPGSMLAGRRELARQFGVDTNTVQYALRLLVDDGTLRAEGRRGTFVAPLSAASATAQFTTPAATATANTQRVVGVVASVSPKIMLDPSVSEAWQGPTLHALEVELGHEAGITVNFHNMNSEASRHDLTFLEGIRDLIDQGADALVAVGPKADQIDEILRLADSRRVPIVLVMPDYQNKRMSPQVRYDNAHAGYLAAEHLVQRGYREITFFGPYPAPWADERLIGLREALDRAGIAGDHLEISECDHSLDTARINQEDVAFRYANELFDAHVDKANRNAWGIVAINDHAAYGLVRAAADHGLTPGVDFGLVSFDDRQRSRDIGLTSLRPPYDRIGTEAGKMVRQVFEGGAMPMEVCLQSHVVARRSSMPVTS